MAAKLFIEERTYSKIERGEQKSMDIRFVASIADILNTKVCTLLQDPMEIHPGTVTPVAEAAPEAEHEHICGMPSAQTKQWDIAMEIRLLKEEIKELVSFHKETLQLLKNDT